MENKTDTEKEKDDVEEYNLRLFRVVATPHKSQRRSKPPTSFPSTSFAPSPRILHLSHDRCDRLKGNRACPMALWYGRPFLIGSMIETSVILEVDKWLRFKGRT
jgi:hypothetical protein